MSKIFGVFLSDLHLPDSIDLKPIFKFLKAYSKEVKKKGKFVLILGGDVIDAKGMHGIDSMKAEAFKREWYIRDHALLSWLLVEIKKVCSPDEVVFLEGNHEDRYTRLEKKYPDAFKGAFKFKEMAQEVFPKLKWLPYGNYNSFYKIGDCIFTHGTIFPDSHAKKYAYEYTPNKVVYGHLHTFQGYTMHNAAPSTAPRYALIGGGLTDLSPDWKRGYPHKWLNGFVSFFSEDGITTPTPHIIEKGQFSIGGKIYR